MLFRSVNNCLIANSCMSVIIYSLSLKGFQITLCSRGVNVMPSSVQPSDHSHSLVILKIYGHTLFDYIEVNNQSNTLRDENLRRI